MKIFKNLYDWVLSLGHKKQGAVYLSLLAFIESSVFPIPPDPLLMMLVLGRRDRYLYYFLLCTLFSTLGGILGYFIGLYFWDMTQVFFFQYVPGFSEELFQSMQGRYNQYSFWIVFAAGFTPIPYKIFTISSGVFQIPLPGFILASLVGRGLRFFLVALLLFLFGQKLQEFIEKYFNLLSFVFLFLLIAGFAAIKLLF